MSLKKDLEEKSISLKTRVVHKESVLDSENNRITHHVWVEKYYVEGTGEEAKDVIVERNIASRTVEGQEKTDFDASTGGQAVIAAVTGFINDFTI